MNHSHTFWVQLHALYPRAKEAVVWLNAYQPESYLKPQENRPPTL